jgi:hypothetical protein
VSDQSDPIPVEDRPHRVSAESGLDPDPETTGVDPRNLPQGAGRYDDDEHAERVAASQEATADTTATTADTTATTTSASYDASQLEGKNADDVVDFVRAADDDDDRAARVAVARQVEDAREGGPRKTVTDELDR